MSLDTAEGLKPRSTAAAEKLRRSTTRTNAPMSPDGSIFGSIHSCGSPILFHFAPLSLLVGAIKSSGRMAASAATIDGGRHESPGRMPLRGNRIGGGGESVQG